MHKKLIRHVITRSWGVWVICMLTARPMVFVGFDKSAISTAEAAGPNITQQDRRLILNNKVAIPFVNPIARWEVSSDRRWLSVLTSEPGEVMPGQQTLFVYRLSDVKRVYQQDLLSVQFLRLGWGVPSNGNRPIDVMAGVQQLFTTEKTHWSPNSRYLAFAAAYESPSSDLYVFDTHTLTSTHLTDGPTQIGDIHWSPDSRWIVHQAVGNFGTGAGWSVEALWAATPNGSIVKKMVHNENFQAFRIIAWVNSRQMLTMLNTIGPSNRIQLLFLDDPTQNKTLFEANAFLSKAVFDATAQKVFFITQKPISKPTKLGDGRTYWSVSLDGSPPQKIREGAN